MNPEIEASLDRIEDGVSDLKAGARGGVHGLVTSARQRGREAAGRIARGKQPLEKLSGLGLALSAVSHRTTDRVLKQQTSLAANQLDLLALRLERAAAATSFRDLLTGQIRLTPEQLSKLGRDARESLSILVEGGSDARDVLRKGLGELTGRGTAKRGTGTASPAPAKRKAGKKKTARRKKAAGKTARKVKRKTAAAPTAS